MNGNTLPIFNDIRINLRSSNNPSPTENDRRSQSSVPSRISRYSGKIALHQSLCGYFFLEQNIHKSDQQILYIRVNQQSKHPQLNLEVQQH